MVQPEGEKITMNFLFCGQPSDLNIGNGKTLSAVRAIFLEKQKNPEKKIFSNIQLKNIEWEKFTPDNVMEVLNTENSIVLFDEISSIIHKNHRISTTCKNHQDSIGLCYKLTSFLRQVRKRKIDVYFTAQVFLDVQKQIRDLIHCTIICEKYFVSGGSLRKCDRDFCDHAQHFIRQIDMRTGKEEYINSIDIHDAYDSSEIVSGWQ